MLLRIKQLCLYFTPAETPKDESQVNTVFATYSAIHKNKTAHAVFCIPK